MKKESNIAKLMKFAGSFKILTYLSWFFSAASSLVGLLPFYYMYKIVEEIFVVTPNFELANTIVSNGWNAVMYACMSMSVYFLGLACSHVAAFRIASNIRRQLMKHILSLPIGTIDSFGSGNARKIVHEASESMEMYLAHQLPDRAGAIATPIGLLVLLFSFDWRMGVLSIFPIIIGFVIMMAMTGKRMVKKMEEYQNALASMSNEAVEYVRGISVVKTFGQSVFTFKKFKEAIDNYKVWVIAYTKDLRTPMLLYTTIINSIFVFLIIGFVSLTGNTITQELLLNFIFYVLITPIISISLTKIMFSSNNTLIVNDALARIDSIQSLSSQYKSRKPMQVKETDIKIKNVIFSYDGLNNAIDGVSLNIEAGKTIALVGPSGGGKTTLASLISRFFDVSSGEIKLGDTNIKDISKEELMDTISFVFQDSKLLQVSILENVQLGRPEASEEDVIRALHLAQCDDIIEKLPKGIHSVVGKEGVFLSGGEQQRIAIARVILKDSPIVVLDEATAFADPDNESKVQAAFKELSKNKTLIMIAHRLSTIVNAEQIVVLNNGKVEEKGTHEELISKNGLYSTMWETYCSFVEWKVKKEVIV